MEFVHRSYEKGKTIAGIATPTGEGGIAIIRISGDESFSIANTIFSGDVLSYQSHHAHYGKILDEKQNAIDHVLLLPMKGPKSFTGEDTVEIHCHGGSLITRKVLARVLSAGALTALPGEFSYKAYMNGKIDLTQAEAIQEMISAKNEHALKTAKHQLEGLLKEKILSYQERLVHIAAIFEAWVDYPEEGLEFASYDEILLSLNQVFNELDYLCQTYDEGKIFKEGVKLSLIGVPNVGKSSLLNALAGKERAIVTDIAGTTRDTLDVDLSFGGLHFTLTDTAGIRETQEIIEQEGIKRSFTAAEESDLILFVVDSQKGLAKEDESFLERLPQKKTILVWNKIDLIQTLQSTSSHPYQAFISAKKNSGIEKLKLLIQERIFQGNCLSNDQVIITNQRHHQALLEARLYLKGALDGLKNELSPELLSMDIKATLKELGTIIGTNITEDILNAIFSKFCVGK